MTVLDRFIARLIEEGSVTAAAALVARGTEVVAESFGRADSSTLFDLASVTKPFSATLALVLDQSGDLPLATPVGEIFAEAGPRVAAITLEELLRHRAGLRRWMPLYSVCRDRAEARQRLLAGDWLDATGEVYSDLDFMLWGFSVERALGASYPDLLQERVLDSLGAAEFSLGGAQTDMAECALPTGVEVDLAAAVGLEIEELPPPQRGQPQDGNTRFLAAPCGHAGLFATLTGVAALAGIYFRPGGLLSAESVSSATRGGGRYGLGWFRSDETPAGRVLGPRAFGHEGFVGSSVWLEPGGRVAVLLAHRSSLKIEMSGLRERFHHIAMEL